MNSFTTKAGTVIPILDLKGQNYLKVANRVQWFREEHPKYAIITEIISHSDNYALFRATIRDEDSQVLATAHGREDAKHFPDYVEKAETKAVGRALALCGYGTQFTTDLDEHHRLADSPLLAPPTASITAVAHLPGAPIKQTKPQTDLLDGLPPETPHRSFKPAIVDEAKSIEAEIRKLITDRGIIGPQVLHMLKNNYNKTRLAELTVDEMKRFLEVVKVYKITDRVG